MKYSNPFLISLILLSASIVALSVKADIMIPMHLVTPEGMGEKIGHISITENERGVQLKPDLRDLPPGTHGFHVHENPSCEPKEKDGEMKAAGAAGSHYDPHHTGKHSAPWGEDGHLGDLPALTVTSSGTSTQPIVASRLSFTHLHNRSLVIHAGSDNYSDYPEPLGGGGDRIACGVISVKP